MNEWKRRQKMMNEVKNWSEEEWVEKRNAIILKFIAIEKAHLRDNGTPDVKDTKIVDELIAALKREMR